MSEPTILDVRSEPPVRRHELIFTSFDDLPTGDAFVLVNDHDPKPLYYQLEAEQTGKNFIGAYDAYGINAIYLENFWNDGSPAIQERFFDNFVVSTARIGC